MKCIKVILFSEYVDDDWLRGRLDKIVGIFPRSFVIIDGEVCSITRLRYLYYPLLS